jgi:AbrB family looped-hinge helix DNA binding protein
MPTITMTSKGQFTLPVATRTNLRLAKGTQMDVDETSDGKIILTPKPPKKGGLSKLYGFINYDGPPVSIEDMDRGIAEAVAERLRNCQ